jgi:hypothetical protein
MGRTFGPSLHTLKIVDKVAWEQLREGETVEDGWASLVAALPNLRTTIVLGAMYMNRQKPDATLPLVRACEKARRALTMRMQPGGFDPKGVLNVQEAARQSSFITYEPLGP